METDRIDTLDAADEALKTALAVADLLSCIGDTPTLDGTVQEIGRLLIRVIQEAKAS